MVIFGAHTFVNYANNLYASKILGLKIATTQPLAIFTNMRKIIINEDLSKAHTDTVNRKVAYQKYSAFTHFTKTLCTAQMPARQRQLVRT